MVYFYLIAAGALLPILNNFVPIFEKGYSWWLAPLLYLVFFFGMVLIQIGLVFLVFAVVGTKQPSKKAVKFYRIMVKYTLPLIIWIAKVKINVTGMDPDEVPKNRKMLFVCNHQHDFDPAVILSVFPDNEIGFIGKKDIIKKLPFIAKIMYLLDGLFIDRENDREAAKTIIEATRALKSEKSSIGLFPEGYTSKTCELLPFRNGGFKMALKAKVPIVVCVINNTRAIPKRMCRMTTKVDFKIVDVIYPEVYEGMNTTELGDMIHEKMEIAYNEIKNK
ncbi:MAG: 1-acyl-sn-glycerol-3-phosphate acyltransferase [Clostridia bacterium]|nr:1-acyl-sn-glycerol-3-phosphate acyltransferase [Clostridia bacterium]